MDFGAGVYLSEAQNPIPPLYNVYVYPLYSILIHTGKGAKEINQREARSKVPT
jgi:hypothetical protein